MNEPAGEDIIEVKSAAELANFMREELTYHGFDLSYGERLRPMLQPDYGVDTSLVAAIRFLTPALDIPVVAVLLNTQLLPMPSGQRCRALGKAIAGIIGERRERIGLVASGGLWHDHHGFRAGFVDDRLDQWVLRSLERGLSERLEPLFAVESDTGYGGLAEMRLWATLAAACESFGAKAVTVDYFPSDAAGAGVGFAYWPPEAPST
jgi:protocatechuate 4,5-dioxygenase beta chain